jgi:3-oxoacyl-[acyl-carrier protein] reductase
MPPQQRDQQAPLKGRSRQRGQPGRDVTRQDTPWCVPLVCGALVAMTSIETGTEQSRTVLVTGSTSGIGAATAHALAAQGWRVVVTGRDHTRGAAVVADIQTAGGQAVFVPSDLTGSSEALRAFARAATRAAGGVLDAVVHNAALCPAVDTVGLTDADLEATLAVNIRAPHVLTAALAPAMAERGHGAIVVIGSWMAHVGHPFVGLYSATKAAEIQLARSWAAEFGPSGVRVNTVSPGATRTPINASDDDVIARMTAGTPAGRPGTPEESAAAVTWLLSPHAGYIHGAELAVDGGINTARST